MYKLDEFILEFNVKKQAIEIYNKRLRYLDTSTLVDSIKTRGLGNLTNEEIIAKFFNGATTDKLLFDQIHYFIFHNQQFRKYKVIINEIHQAANSDEYHLYKDDNDELFNTTRWFYQNIAETFENYLIDLCKNFLISFSPFFIADVDVNLVNNRRIISPNTCEFEINNFNEDNLETITNEIFNIIYKYCQHTFFNLNEFLQTKLKQKSFVITENSYTINFIVIS